MLQHNDFTSLYNQIINDGGFSIDIIDNSIPGAGYMVSIPGAEKITPLSNFSDHTIARYIEDNARQLAIPGAYLGAWLDGSEVYLDISINVESLAAALSLAREYRQLAIYDICSGESIYVAAAAITTAAVAIE